MAELNNISALAGNMNRFREAACISASRIFDSCSGKECLEDLQVHLDDDAQKIVNAATGVVCRRAEAYDTQIKVEPIAFNSGHFNVTATCYFRLHFSATPSASGANPDFMGLAYCTQKAVLFGSESGVRTFRSGQNGPDYDPSGLPMAVVQMAEPIVLGAKIENRAPAYTEPLGAIPARVEQAFPRPLQTVIGKNDKVLLVSLGLFSITTLERGVQLMIPTYDYSVPEKDCSNSDNLDNPCEVFRRISFPVDEFFPENSPGSRC